MGSAGGLGEGVGVELVTAFNDAWYRQPDPAGWADEGRPSNGDWVLVSAVWLLAAWSGESAPGWEPAFVFGKGGDRWKEPWPAPPEHLAEIAGLPEVTGAVPYVALEVENGDGDERTVPPEELVELLAGAVHVHADDTRRTALVRYLADQATGPYDDLLRLVTADDGPALHLLHRDYYGTARITLAPAPEVRQPPILAEDGADGALRTRIACLATLLSDRLMVNNNNSVDFRFRIGTLPESGGENGGGEDEGGEDEGGDGTPEDRLAAATRWWSATREDAEEHADDVRTFRPATFAELRASLHVEARMSLTDLWDGSWSGVEEMPEIPAGHVVPHLVDDLVDVIEGRMGGALVAVNGYLPTAWPPADPTGDEEDDVEYAYVLFVRGHEAAVLDIDRSC